ncbi:hypothetical protein [Amycolatopsis taiwanensis]|uniref:hypothetical protein n=1 Tax=Amycolatopsis taiwanensis TaxID=342230 RepID=UPI000487D342|nr:hypothetical protein [Amycolatopsis taiwanensis]
MGVVLFILLPIMVVTIGLPLIPWRPLVLRLFLLVAQVVATGFLIALVPLRWEVWAVVLGPGSALAILRGLEAALDMRDKHRQRSGNHLFWRREHSR